MSLYREFSELVMQLIPHGIYILDVHTGDDSIAFEIGRQMFVVHGFEHFDVTLFNGQHPAISGDRHVVHLYREYFTIDDGVEQYFIQPVR